MYVGPPPNCLWVCMGLSTWRCIIFPLNSDDLRARAQECSDCALQLTLTAHLGLYRWTHENHITSIVLNRHVRTYKCVSTQTQTQRNPPLLQCIYSAAPSCEFKQCLCKVLMGIHSHRHMLCAQCDRMSWLTSNRLQHSYTIGQVVIKLVLLYQRLIGYFR